MSDGLGLDIVSPLPPVRSGIADYMADLLPQLASRCDLRIVRLDGAEVDEAFSVGVPVIDASRLGEEGRLPLYQMGNNHHHRQVHALALEHPGVLTLHDLVLHHFLIEETWARGDFDAYHRRLVEDEGWIGEAVAPLMRRPAGVGNAVQFALPVNRRLLGRQRGVLVHSSWAAEWLREDLPELAVAAVPMGVPLPPAADEAARLAFRRRYDLPVEAPVLGSFGFQTPIKRTDVVVRALARPELAGAHLMVVGEVADDSSLLELARTAGVAERVHVLGFLPFEELAAAIAAADLCLNLRYPTAGETSASLLRILAVGRGALVSEHAQSADLPDEGILKVPLGDGEVSSLAAQVASLLADPQGLRRLGEAARRHVATEHRPDRAAQAVVDACRRFRRRTPIRPGPAPVPTPTNLVWHSLPGKLAVEGPAAPWPEGERREVQVRLTNNGVARWLAGERPDGGVFVQLKVLRTEDGEVRKDQVLHEEWRPLPIDLPPEGTQHFRFVVRKPPGSSRMVVMPQIAGRVGLPRLGGPQWEADL